MKMTGDQRQQIYAHAAQTYPAECCGFLLGHDDLVYQTRRAVNQSQTPANHFLITPYEFAQTLSAATDAKLDIIGIYHSHPNAPSRPSSIDRDNAWPETFFLIVSVYAGKSFKAQVWRLTGAKFFKEVPLEMIDT